MSGDVGNQRQSGAPDFRFLSQFISPRSAFPPAIFTTPGTSTVTCPSGAGAAFIVAVGGGGGADLRFYGSAVASPRGRSGGGGGGIAAMVSDVQGVTFSVTVGAGGAGSTIDANNRGGDSYVTRVPATLGNAYDDVIAFGAGRGTPTTAPGSMFPGQVAYTAMCGGPASMQVNRNAANDQRYISWTSPGGNGSWAQLQHELVTIDGTTLVPRNPVLIECVGGMPGMTPLPPYVVSAGRNDIYGRGGDVLSTGSATDGQGGCVCIWWCY